ncbi:hypothetical protein H2248_002522 [Termitomyces sp. 'cryptogamus']|nr:hypothetical protein H2248_002522 [Termitomyces sp. 'cryptogamus']
MKQRASNLLGSHNPDIRCIDQSGCTSPLSISELQRFLSPKMMDLWERAERAQSRRALESACLENLYYCPFCDWACIIEGEMTGILICRNKSVCGRSSCIRCGKLDHRPDLCDDQLAGKHHIDEAMSGALVRNCPGCKKPFIKEAVYSATE